MTKIKLFFEYVYMSIYKVSGTGSGRYILMMAMGFIFFTSMLLFVLFNLSPKIFLFYFALPIWGIAFIYFLFNMDDKIVEKYKGMDFSYGRSYLVFIAVAIFAFLPLLLVILIKYFQRL